MSDQTFHIKHQLAFMKFDVTEARAITAGRPRVRLAVSPQWNSMVYIDKATLPNVDMNEPVIIATVFFPQTKEVIPMMIDGHHRMQRAINEKLEELESVVLDVKETERVITRLPPE